MNSETRLLTYGEAVALLPDGGQIHTLLGRGHALTGADWDRGAVLALLENTSRREITGPAAQATGHGLAAFRSDGVPVFIETRKDDGDPQQPPASEWAGPCPKCGGLGDAHKLTCATLQLPHDVPLYDQAGA